MAIIRGVGSARGRWNAPALCEPVKNAPIPSANGGILWADDVNKKIYIFVPYAYDVLLENWEVLGAPLDAIESVSYGADMSIPPAGETYYYDEVYRCSPSATSLRSTTRPACDVPNQFGTQNLDLGKQNPSGRAVVPLPAKSHEQGRAQRDQRRHRRRFQDGAYQRLRLARLGRLHGPQIRREDSDSYARDSGRYWHVYPFDARRAVLSVRSRYYCTGRRCPRRGSGGLATGASRVAAGAQSSMRTRALDRRPLYDRDWRGSGGAPLFAIQLARVVVDVHAAAEEPWPQRLGSL
ncbi:Uu.00g058090.m01.CDS01 [Anthostomella pinea]|uniref:Uu.00g058090.m01.CDS01 n=1 Tax=Anthostomella pinea TaxID=933095 RepID=A0AAI8VSG4_9PEZI|nr:Uu.00g058090.m01.CDS01 [Anthostomella pinea]